MALSVGGVWMMAFENVYFSYGGDFSIQDMSFDCKAGKIIGFLGRNGSGKTTIMNLLSGLAKPESGQIIVDGMIWTAERHVQELIRNKISYLPSEDFFFGNLTIKENWELVGKLRYKDKNRYTYWAEQISQFGLNEYYNTYFSDCSTGTKRKAQIIATLMGGSKALVLDEPHNGLDVFSTRQLNNILFEIRKKAESVIVISNHIVEVLEKLCDEIIIVDGGTKVAEFTHPLQNIEEKYFQLIKNH